MRTGAAALLAVLTVVALAPAGATAEREDRGDRGDQAAAAAVRLEGRGYGHGRGMSQYGAQGAAREGRSHRQILDFYYPGLSWGRATGGVAVLISGDTSGDVVVDARSGLRVKSLGSGNSFALKQSGARRWRITSVSGGRSRVSVLTRSWHSVRLVAGDAQFSASGRPITLHTPSRTVSYRGALRSATPGTGAGRDTVNVVPLDAYLLGVVPLEVPALWHPQAVRAQAVAARTYAAHERRTPLARHYQLCDTSQCQVYGGYSAEHPASNDAVAATAERVLVDRGAPAFTQFSASNGGWSVAGAQPYLRARSDPYDRWSGNPYRSWTVSIPRARFAAAYPAIGSFRSLRVVERDGHGAWGGRALRVRITGSRASTTITGDTFRTVFGLRSTWFRQR